MKFWNRQPNYFWTLTERYLRSCIPSPIHDYDSSQITAVLLVAEDDTGHLDSASRDLVHSNFRFRGFSDLFVGKKSGIFCGVTLRLNLTIAREKCYIRLMKFIYNPVTFFCCCTILVLLLLLICVGSYRLGNLKVENEVPVFAIFWRMICQVGNPNRYLNEQVNQVMKVSKQTKKANLKLLAILRIGLALLEI